MTAYTDAVHAEPGCICFDCCASIDRPDEYAIVEAFTSKQAGDGHVQTPHFKEFLVWFPTVIAAPARIINTEVAGQGWSTMSEFS
jgi:quinol monooxygenase YgiN